MNNDVPLGEVVTHKKGFAFKSKDYVESGLPLVKVSDFGMHTVTTASTCLPEDYSESHAEWSLEEGDILISTVGSWASNPNSVVGKVVKVSPSLSGALLNQNTVRLRSNQCFDQRFLFYCLKQESFQSHCINVAQGSANQASITLSDIKRFLLPAFDSKHQKAIAHILGTLDDKIELNQKMNLTLEEIAKAIFKSWFVDFDPVRAKAEGRPTGLPPEMSDLFPDELVDSEIGEIPRGWNVQPLSNQIKVNPKYTLKKGAEAYFVEMKCLSESTASIGEGYLRGFTSGSKFRRFDTLFARITPCLENGKTGLLLNSSASEVCWGSTEFIVLSPKDDQSPLFPYCWARDENLRNAAVSSMTGSSGRQRVPNDFFDRYLVADPDSSFHQTFAKVADPIMKRIQVCEEEITTLTELRDALLPKLISGELRIPDAEKFLEEAGI